MMISKKTIHIILGCLLLSNTSFSTDHLPDGNVTSVDISDFLATALDDRQVTQREEMVDFIEGAPGNTAFIRSLEFRTETDRFAIANQKYSLRFYPASLVENRSNRELQSSSVKASRQEQELVLHQALRWRYRLALRYLYNLERLGLKRELVQLHRDQVQVLNQSSGNLDFDINDLLQSQEQLIEVELDVIELDSRDRQLTTEIQNCFSMPTQLNFEGGGLYGVTTVTTLLDTLCGKAVTTSPYLRSSQARVELSGAEFNLKQARERQIFNFFKVTYDYENHLDTREALFVELGVKIPIGSGNQLELDRSHLEYLAETAEHSELVRELELELEQSIADLGQLLEQIALLEKQKTDSSAETTLAAMQRYPGTEPLSLLRLRESVVKRDLQQVTLNYLLRMKYIELLDLNGSLSQLPLRNWLSGDLEMLYHLPESSDDE